MIHALEKKIERYCNHLSIYQETTIQEFIVNGKKKPE